MRIIVCADSSKVMGFGHITRALTLARALGDAGAEVIAIGRGMTEGASFSQSFQGCRTVEDSDGSESGRIGLIRNLSPDGLVADGYHFSEGFYASLQEAEIPYSVVDDNGQTRARTPILVHNQNPHATKSLYSFGSHKPTLLLGPEFMLVRPEVKNFSGSPHSRTKHVLLNFGGTDARDLTIPFAKGLLANRVPLALREDFRASIESELREKKLGADIKFFSRAEFLSALAASRFAVLGAGTSVWEANALGIATVAVVITSSQMKATVAAKKRGYLKEFVDATNTSDPVSRVYDALISFEETQHAGEGDNFARIPLDGADRVARKLMKKFSREKTKKLN